MTNFLASFSFCSVSIFCRHFPLVNLYQRIFDSVTFGADNLDLQVSVFKFHVRFVFRNTAHQRQTKPPKVSHSSSGSKTPRHLLTSSTEAAPLIRHTLRLTFSISGQLGGAVMSSSKSPTSSSNRSLMVTMPSTPPYSSTTPQNGCGFSACS